MKNNNGVFTQNQEDLTEEVYDLLIYKPKADKIKKQISKIIRGEQ